MHAATPPGREPGWGPGASCLNDPTGVFSADLDGPDATETIDQARQVCAGCSVRLPCLTQALTDRSRTGIRAGTTPSQRDEMLRTTTTTAPSYLLQEAVRVALAAVTPVPLALAKPAEPRQPGRPTTYRMRPVPAPRPRRDPLVVAVDLVLAGRPVAGVCDLVGLPIRTVVQAVRAEMERRAETISVASPAAPGPAPSPTPSPTPIPSSSPGSSGTAGSPSGPAEQEPGSVRSVARRYGTQQLDVHGQITCIVRVTPAGLQAARDKAARAKTTLKQVLRGALEAVADGTVTVPSVGDGSESDRKQIGTTVDPDIRDRARAAARRAGVPLRDLIDAALIDAA